MLCSENQNVINSFQNKEKLTQQWKESVIILIYKKGDKTDSRNYRGTLLLTVTHKI
jgi:hypothetical protein